VKVSVSLPAEDLEFVDEYAKEQRSTRSAVLHKAVRLLRAVGLGAAYEDAWREWAEGREEEAWKLVPDDGLAT
jgi:Arc/MetJ-type ribon-helix-helix transcriptional regulator